MTGKADPVRGKLGAEVRRLRLLAGITQETLGNRVRISKPMVSAIERGTRLPKPDIVDGLDDALSTGGALKRLWREVNGTRDVPEWFRNALLIERRSREIREYEPLVVPGLLQTHDYARTLLRTWHVGSSNDKADQAARARVERLPTLLSSRPLLRFVVAEPVVTHVVGSSEIMKHQLEHIRSLVEEGVMTFQVLQRTPDGPGTCLPLRICSMSPVQTIGYVEHVLGGEVVEDPELVSQLMTVFGDLQAAALSPHESATLLDRVKGEIECAIGTRPHTATATEATAWR